MQFLMADTFTASLARLTGEEQKLVKTTAFDLQLNPGGTGMQFHKLDRAKDKNFWSVRVSGDLRIIVHRGPESLLLCYVDHHDKAYYWAERRKIQIHPKTGAAQLVEIRETVREVVVPRYVDGPVQAAAKAPLFARMSDEELLSYGVPAGWLPNVRQADEDSLLLLADRLPAEAAEALLELAVGGKPRAARPPVSPVSPFAHPDAQRRFRIMNNAEELERALEFPWDRWTVFLHPDQREMVEHTYNGPARIAGSAGTGKTIVALHRAVFLARGNPDARVLLTTFSEVLANALRGQLRRLISNEPRLAERLEVHAIDTLGDRLHRAHCGTVALAPRALIQELLSAASAEVGGHKFSGPFLLSEWEQVVDAWQLETWEAYRAVVRLGRKTRLPEAQRVILWSVFERVRSDLAARRMTTRSGQFARLTAALEASPHPPFDFAVVDEAQDIGVAHLRFLTALGRHRPDALFFTGDLGQRIFQQPFSWLALGVDIRGRSRRLQVNYRTSHQIRMQADRLLGPEVADADGNTEDRRHTVSVFNGPQPDIRVLATREEETTAVSEWLAARRAEGVALHEIALFVRSEAELDRARAAVERGRLPYRILDEKVETATGKTSVAAMHLAKGLEFRAVAVMACDDEVIPSQERISAVGDDSDLEDVYNTERHLLYVACTRAREHLLVSSVAPESEFLADLGISAIRNGSRG
jgi:mRNA-degrading endonuclease RelE of RelBE toxin-antitoxin system